MGIVRFLHSEGEIEGIHKQAPAAGAPLVIITNGHNGFYSYGMFPYIQEWLHAGGVSSYSFNFSHGGTTGASDYFSDLGKYEKNCMRLETLDLITVIQNARGSLLGGEASAPLYLMSHSLGVIPTLFAASRCRHNQIDGIILLSPPSTLDIFPEKMVRTWMETGVFVLRNNRTGQDLPQGPEFLTEIQQAHTTWSVETVVREFKSPCLIVHGQNDEAVPTEHAQALRQWFEHAGHRVQLNIIDDAGHTFNTTHPFEGTTPALETLLLHVRDWLTASQPDSRS